MSSEPRVFSPELERFVTSIRVRARQDEVFLYRSREQLITLIITINNALRDKENRKPVLRAITGLPLKSQNELTAFYHSVLIDETVDGKSDELLRQIEDLVEDDPHQRPWDLFPWYRPGAGVSDLQLAYSDEWGSPRGPNNSGTSEVPETDGSIPDLQSE